MRYLAFFYSAGEFYQNSFFQYFRARVDHRGLVDWSFGGPLQVSCSVDTTLYPFDRQRCGLVVENWAYNVEYVDLRNGIDTVQKDGYHDSGIFAVADPGGVQGVQATALSFRCLF